METDNKEQLNKLDEKIKQLQAQKNKILAREKEKERKARTRLLIQIGAILEKCNIKTLDDANKIVELYKNDSVFRNKIDATLTTKLELDTINENRNTENSINNNLVTRKILIND